jgi:hypothetical protein
MRVLQASRGLRKDASIIGVQNGTGLSPDPHKKVWGTTA